MIILIRDVIARHSGLTLTYASSGSGWRELGPPQVIILIIIIVIIIMVIIVILIIVIVIIVMIIISIILTFMTVMEILDTMHGNCNSVILDGDTDFSY